LSEKLVAGGGGNTGAGTPGGVDEERFKRVKSERDQF
jgi:hypothetical protein